MTVLFVFCSLEEFEYTKLNLYIKINNVCIYLKDSDPEYDKHRYECTKV